MIHLGPLVTKSEGTLLPVVNLKHTGFNLDFLVDGELYSHPIFQDTEYWKSEKPSFRDFYLAASAMGWGFEFDHRGFHRIEQDSQEFFAVSPVLRSAYSENGFSGDVVDVLREFRSNIRVSSYGDPVWYEEPSHEILLAPSIRGRGFAVGSVMGYGGKLEVEIIWSFRDNYDGWMKIHAGNIEFRPRAGKIGPGKWKPIHWPESIEDLFWKRLRSVVSDTPADVFASVDELNKLAALFKWTGATMKTPKELATLRMELVSNNIALWNDPKELAQMLKHGELYSENTSISQIVKSLPRLIAKVSGTVD